ncbi:hypothetical protein L915_00540 [Phytophthora nicotianae]|nr:hypothetical protein L915_00540 [Phytophthora nicotianae]
MYAWYFPKDIKDVGLIKKALRHDWVNLVVWLDNPALAKPKILATATSTFGAYYKNSKPFKRSEVINGITPKVCYDNDDYKGWHTIFPFHEEGEYQDLIQWNQLTDAAREAFENGDFGEANVPFNDAYFETNLKSASR